MQNCSLNNTIGCPKSKGALQISVRRQSRAKSEGRGVIPTAQEPSRLCGRFRSSELPLGDGGDWQMAGIPAGMRFWLVTGPGGVRCARPPANGWGSLRLGERRASEGARNLGLRSSRTPEIPLGPTAPARFRNRAEPGFTNDEPKSQPQAGGFGSH